MGDAQDGPQFFILSVHMKHGVKIRWQSKLLQGSKRRCDFLQSSTGDLAANFPGMSSKVTDDASISGGCSNGARIGGDSGLISHGFRRSIS